jgi:hypothetical protein
MPSRVGPAAPVVSDGRHRLHVNRPHAEGAGLRARDVGLRQTRPGRPPDTARRRLGDLSWASDRACAPMPSMLQFAGTAQVVPTGRPASRDSGGPRPGTRYRGLTIRPDVAHRADAGASVRRDPADENVTAPAPACDAVTSRRLRVWLPAFHGVLRHRTSCESHSAVFHWLGRSPSEGAVRTPQDVLPGSRLCHDPVPQPVGPGVLPKQLLAIVPAAC